MTKDEIVEKLIYSAVDELAATMPHLKEFKKELDTPLFGPTAAMDSMGLVNFVVCVEDRIEEETSRAIRLVSAQAMSRKNSPFRTVSTLADYIHELMTHAG